MCAHVRDLSTYRVATESNEFEIRSFSISLCWLINRGHHLCHSKWLSDQQNQKLPCWTLCSQYTATRSNCNGNITIQHLIQTYSSQRTVIWYISLSGKLLRDFFLAPTVTTKETSTGVKWYYSIIYTWSGTRCPNCWLVLYSTLCANYANARATFGGPFMGNLKVTSARLCPPLFTLCGRNMTVCDWERKNEKQQNQQLKDVQIQEEGARDLLAGREQTIAYSWCCLATKKGNCVKRHKLDTGWLAGGHVCVWS